MSKQQHSWSKDNLLESVYDEVYICNQCKIKVGLLTQSKIIHEDEFVHVVENGEIHEVHYKGNKLSVYCDDMMIQIIMDE